MDDSLDSKDAPYKGLNVRSADLFPLVCARCERTFTDLNDFIARTTPIYRSSGLVERHDPATGTFVLLLRSCLCGTSLALKCSDRRDQSESGQLRRRRFDALVLLLVDAGNEPEAARQQVRKLFADAGS